MLNYSQMLSNTNGTTDSRSCLQAVEPGSTHVASTVLPSLGGYPPIVSVAYKSANAILL